MDDRGLRALFVGLGLTLCLGLGFAGTARACSTPLEWQGVKPVPWNRDGNRNSIEDSLDSIVGSDPNRKVSVVLDLTRCADPAAMDLLASYGKVLKRGKFVTFVAMEVPAGKLPNLASLSLVAKIEQMHGFSAGLDVSGAAIKVRSGFYTPQTLEDVMPTVRGAGRTLAVIDSGVDDQDGVGVTHQMFPPGKFVGGYDAFSHTLSNPDDSFGHGSHVAGIAIGAQLGSFRGMAPDAGLVDCQTTLQCGPPSWLDVIECFEQILLNAPAWGVDVVNLSLRQCDTSGNTITTDGADAASMLANHLVAQGITVVAAAGNDGPFTSGLTAPCAADNAICVAAMDDQGTEDRVDDTIAGFSSWGPRANDGDLDTLDESKPDLSAPGVNITSAQADTVSSLVLNSGTSMASPHVAGVAILVSEARPGINPGSIKHLLINTAEDRGPAGWDPENGHGYIDVFQALGAPATADPGYPGAGTYPQPWLCSDIAPASQPQVNVPNTLTAVVQNLTANPATNVQVTFGVYIYSTGIPAFYSIGAQTVSIPAWGQISVTHPWTPQASPSGDPHACLSTTIDYGFDTNFTNNSCQRNISIDQTNSPVTFRFQVQNTLPRAATIKLVPEPLTRFPKELAGDEKFRMLPGERIWVRDRWTHKITKGEVRMEPGDCPVDVSLTLDLADDARAVDGALYDVPGLAITDDGQETVIDGVTAYGHPPCPAEWGGDTDGDAVCDVFDTCSEMMNPEQIDRDGDGIGDLCDPRPSVADAAGNDDVCRGQVLSGELMGGEAYECLEDLKTVVAASPEKAEASPLRQILSDKLDTAQVSICRKNHTQAAARLQALREHLALLAEIGELTDEQGAFLKAKAAACAEKLPSGSAAAAEVRPALKPAAR